jgi:hypothetical protein
VLLRGFILLSFFWPVGRGGVVLGRGFDPFEFSGQWRRLV